MKLQSKRWHWVKYNGGSKQLMNGSEVSLFQQSGGHVKVLRHASPEEVSKLIYKKESA
jgi:hypothetical protein